MLQLVLNPGLYVGAVYYVYLAVAGGRVAYVGVGKRGGYYDRVYMHLRGHSSAARRGLRADVFIILAYTRRRRLAEMWEAWLHAVFSPPYAERRPRRPPPSPRRDAGASRCRSPCPWRNTPGLWAPRWPTPLRF
ncbi:hypothetical protein [Pyrobaculum ferrireducens]|uniref:GIY-YIG domain-containing protein n=1 Tax=Pyrobaculum ferrireducens TaxID=1104324 RepID=G7VHV7_9CREN|nr:hypothetical protein [Pyrobaculum ferrireducens]AET32129.1 hypothetical protein P186_0679 [Pyrobaculum ferrireducens]